MTLEVKNTELSSQAILDALLGESVYLYTLENPEQLGFVAVNNPKNLDVSEYKTQRVIRSGFTCQPLNAVIYLKAKHVQILTS